MLEKLRALLGNKPQPSDPKVKIQWSREVFVLVNILNGSQRGFVRFYDNEYHELKSSDFDPEIIFNDALAETGNHFDAAKKVYVENLQGKYVKTAIGNVLITGKGWNKFKSKLKMDTTRASLVGFIPYIIEKGIFGEREVLHKKREDDIVGFYTVNAELIYKVNAITLMVKIGVKQDHSLYYFMSVPKENPPILLEKRPELSEGGVSVEDLNLDSIIQGNEEEINLFIISVTKSNKKECK